MCRERLIAEWHYVSDLFTNVLPDKERGCPDHQEYKMEAMLPVCDEFGLFSLRIILNRFTHVDFNQFIRPS